MQMIDRSVGWLIRVTLKLNVLNLVCIGLLHRLSAVHLQSLGNNRFRIRFVQPESGIPVHLLGADAARLPETPPEGRRTDLAKLLILVMKFFFLL